jgi:hypothetical protein
MSSSTDQTQDDQLASGQHGFGHDHDDDDVLEGQLVEPQPGAEPAGAMGDDPDSPVDDPIVMDTAPVDPEDDRVVLDSHDDIPDANTPDPASPAAAGTVDGDGSYGSEGTYGSEATAGSAIPMPGGTVDDDVTPAETTLDEGIPDGETAAMGGTAPVDDVTPVDDATAADGVTPVETVTPASTTPVDAAAPVGATAASAVGTTDAAGAANAGRAATTEEWHEILAMFVDDPRAATERAASLVDGRVEALLASVKEQQQSLQSDWQGDGADTEKLRTALQHYRAFWARLDVFAHQV